jgi:hypothetical protein
MPAQDWPGSYQPTMDSRNLGDTSEYILARQPYNVWQNADTGEGRGIFRGQGG